MHGVGWSVFPNMHPYKVPSVWSYTRNTQTCLLEKTPSSLQLSTALSLTPYNLSWPAPCFLACENISKLICFANLSVPVYEPLSYLMALALIWHVYPNFKYYFLPDGNTFLSNAFKARLKI